MQITDEKVLAAGKSLFGNDWRKPTDQDPKHLHSSWTRLHAALAAALAVPDAGAELIAKLDKIMEGYDWVGTGSWADGEEVRNEWLALRRLLVAALSRPPAGTEPSPVACACTLVKQDESCPVGYPSLLCDICQGRGVVASPPAPAPAEPFDDKWLGDGDSVHVAPAPAPAVVALEWEPKEGMRPPACDPKSAYMDARTETLVGFYTITAPPHAASSAEPYELKGPWTYQSFGEWSHFDTLEAAKAAAQADFEARIRSALVDAPAAPQVDLRLQDPHAVYLNMLRGSIAKPSLAQIIHLYGSRELAEELQLRGHAPAAPRALPDGWQSMETAPKDGKPLDLWIGGHEFPRRVPDAYWGRPYHTCGEAGQYCDSCPPDLEVDAWRDPLAMGMDVGGIKGATHWMRTAAPSAQGGE